MFEQKNKSAPDGTQAKWLLPRASARELVTPLGAAVLVVVELGTRVVTPHPLLAVLPFEPRVAVEVAARKARLEVVEAVVARQGVTTVELREVALELDRRLALGGLDADDVVALHDAVDDGVGGDDLLGLRFQLLVLLRERPRARLEAAVAPRRLEDDAVTDGGDARGATEAVEVDAAVVPHEGRAVVVEVEENLPLLVVLVLGEDEAEALVVRAVVELHLTDVTLGAHFTHSFTRWLNVSS